jgi:hypothetical protein
LRTGKILGPKRDEVTGGWRELHNEELHDLFSSPNIIRITKSRRMKWAGQAEGMGEKRNAYRLSVGKPQGKRPLGRPRLRWVDNIILRPSSSRNIFARIYLTDNGSVVFRI